MRYSLHTASTFLIAFIFSRITTGFGDTPSPLKRYTCRFYHYSPVRNSTRTCWTSIDEYFCCINHRYPIRDSCGKICGADGVVTEHKPTTTEFSSTQPPNITIKTTTYRPYTTSKPKPLKRYTCRFYHYSPVRISTRTCWTSIDEYFCCINHRYWIRDSCGKICGADGVVTEQKPITTEFSSTQPPNITIKTTTYRPYTHNTSKPKPNPHVGPVVIGAVVVPISLVVLVAVVIAVMRCVHCRRMNRSGDNNSEDYTYRYRAGGEAVRSNIQHPPQNSWREMESPPPLIPSCPPPPMPSCPNSESYKLAPPPSYEEVVNYR